MYDRKTWIVLVICGILIALNIYFGSQNRPAPESEKPKTEQTATPPAADTPPGLTVIPPAASAAEEIIVLENDKAAYSLTNIGGGIKYVELKDQKNVGDKNTNVRLNLHAPGPIAGIVNPDSTLDSTVYTYKADQSTPGKSAVFIAQLPSDIIVIKIFTLQSDDIPGKEYFIKLNVVLKNKTTSNLDLSTYSLFLGTAAPLHQDENSNHTGFFWFEDGEMHLKNTSDFKGGWFGSDKPSIPSPVEENVIYAGVTDQFFTTIIRPQNPALTIVTGKPQQITLSKDSSSLPAVRASIALPPLNVAPGSMTSFDYTIFTGPKANTMLRKLDNNETVGKGWGEVMQYGWFWFVSRPLNWLLNNLHNLIDNFSTTQSWGLAVIFLTIIVRIIIWPLHAKSTRVMKRMSKLQPIMKDLKEKYPDDPTKLNTEMMGLYRKYGINPLGGCLPMFIQIPIFFGFFRMLDYAVELRNQGFLWVTDLSQPDTVGTFAGFDINLLPIVMAVTSVLQIAMMPKTGDKMQQRIIMFMPLMFFFFCYGYASALALYWTTQNIFSIAQTYFMNKLPEPELVARKDGGKKSWVQRMAEKQAEVQKLQKQKAGGEMRNVTPGKKRPPRTGG
jgi:YidC/Oxa1 family membrane protein insertase